MNLIEPPRAINPDAVRRAPDGRIALHFPEGQRSEPGPFWLAVGIRGDLYVELLTNEDTADWNELAHG